MLSVILATHDPHDAIKEFLRAGWELEYEATGESDDRLAIVKIGNSRVMLGVDDPEFLPEAARNFRGAGIDIYVELEAEEDIGSVYENHLKAGLSTDQLADRPWGVKAFHARICGYSFFFAQEDAMPDRN